MVAVAYFDGNKATWNYVQLSWCLFEDVVTCNGELLYAKFHTHIYQFSIGAEKLILILYFT